ncbi:hypothetical protein ABW20_dc0101071 [Dactylellina cionopaga]|nr:hypothetical protein ABW20_dc0101071 [Dactylellina cionopaga]
MSPRHPYSSRSTASSAFLPFPFSVAQYDSDAFDLWWLLPAFNTRPVLSERVSEFVKRNTVANTGERSTVVDALHFSRRLGIYYNFFIILFPILVFVVRKTKARAKRWQQLRRKRNNINIRSTNHNRIKNIAVEGSETNTPSTASSSSSSGNEVNIYNHDATNESKPLLQHTSSSTPSGYTLLYRRLRGFLGYQRPNNKFGQVYPTNGTSIINGVIFFGVVFLAIYKIYLPLDTTNNAALRFFIMADRWGIVFVMNQPLNYLLAAKTSPIKYLTGWSYEQHLIFHMALALMSLYSSLLHFVAMYGVYRMFLARTGESFLSMLAHPDILMGVISFISFWIFGFLSTAIVREKAYELFLAGHIIFSATAMAFLYFHHSTARIYVVLSLGIWLVDRIVYRACRKRWTADAVVKVLDESTVKVSIKNFGGYGRATATSGNNSISKWKWNPAGHIFLTVPSWNQSQAHPFSILTPPTGYDLDINSEEDGTGQQEKEMVLVIRKLRGFSAALFDIGDARGRVKVIVDGPYGSGHSRKALKKCSKCVFIAGGSGIAVAWPLMCEVVRRQVEKTGNGGTRKGKKIVLLWVVHYEHHLNWLDGDLEKLEDMKIRLPRNVEIEIRKFVTKGMNGRRPDLEREITRVVEDEDGLRLEGRTGVVVCGPDEMLSSVRATGSKLLWLGRDIEILAEKFGW